MNQETRDAAIKAARDTNNHTFLAVMAVLEESLNDAQVESVRPEPYGEGRAYNCGRASSIMDLISYLNAIGE